MPIPWSLYDLGTAASAPVLLSSTAPRDFAFYLDMWQAGRLKIDELVSRTGRLEEINEAFAALERGEP